jgi:protein MAK16
LEEKG